MRPSRRRHRSSATRCRRHPSRRRKKDCRALATGLGFFISKSAANGCGRNCFGSATSNGRDLNCSANLRFQERHKEVAVPTAATYPLGRIAGMGHALDGASGGRVRSPLSSGSKSVRLAELSPGQPICPSRYAWMSLRPVRWPSVGPPTFIHSSLNGPHMAPVPKR